MNQTKERNESGIDVDQDFLDRVLNTLYDFGDAANSKRSKKQKHRKKQTDKDEEDAADVEDDYNSKPNGETDLSRDETRCTSKDPKNSEKKESNVEVVIFQDPRKMKKLKRAAEPQAKLIDPPEATDKRKKEADDILTIEKARLDVHRFGITGFQKQQQRVFEQDRAIMLGAHPPKKEYVNYKLYQQTIKEKKMKEKDEVTSDAQKKKKTPGKQKNLRRKSGSSGVEPTGQVGQFKNGMLVLSSKDMQKLNSKVRKRAR